MTALLDAADPGHADTPVFVAAVDRARARAGQWLVAIVTTSVAAHFLIVGLIGFGVGGGAPPAPKRSPVLPPATVEEKVELQPPPAEDPTPVAQTLTDDSPPVPEAPVAANLDLPPLPELAQVTAVPASVPVAFAIPVRGPVRLTNDPARATGAVGGRRPGPISVDASGRLGRNLVLPPLLYPNSALQRRITGSVDVEFHVAPGSSVITEARVRISSGFSELDFAALENLRSGRWVGAPGFYVKSYTFILN